MIERNYSSEKARTTRVKVNQRKKTVGITLPQNLVKRARKNNLNISRISEQALRSILDYLEAQNRNQSSDFLAKASFPKEGLVVPRAGLEPATTRSSASPSTMRVVESSALPI
jgi:post-segregation antitoxin (ccd killing protein)